MKYLLVFIVFMICFLAMPVADAEQDQGSQVLIHLNNFDLIVTYQEVEKLKTKIKYLGCSRPIIVYPEKYGELIDVDWTFGERQSVYLDLDFRTSKGNRAFSFIPFRIDEITDIQGNKISVDCFELDSQEVLEIRPK